MASQKLRHNYGILVLGFVILLTAFSWVGMMTWIISGLTMRPDMITLGVAYVPAPVLVLAAWFAVKEGWRTPSAWCGCGCKG